MTRLSCLLGCLLLAGCAAEAVTPTVERVETPIKRCMNLGNALEAPNEGEWGPVIERDDLRAIASEGFDTVRLPVRWSAHADGQGRIDTAFLARVDQIVNWALEVGLTVVLDVHHYRELEEDADAHIPRLLAMWDQLAIHYADWPDALIFEPINEPNGDFTVEKVNRFNAEVLQRIRVSNPDRWVILGSGKWGNVEPFRRGARPAAIFPEDPRIIATFHSYAPFEWTHQGAHWMDDAPKTGRKLTDNDLRMFASEMKAGADFQRRTGIPVFIGEFGPYVRTIPQEDRAVWTANARRAAERNGLAWCYWDWQTEFAYVDPETHVPLTWMREALFGS